MMMVSDSSHTPPSHLDDATVAAVRAALQTYLADASDSDALRGALLRMSTEARGRSMLPEQVLVTLKDIWNGLPEVRSVSDTGEQVRLLQRVVTMCIKEYYSV